MQGIQWKSLAVALGLFGAAAPAQAAVTISKALVTGGKLVVTGKSTTGTQIKLDSTFTAPIKSDDTFSFSLTYLPADCIVQLQVVGSATKKSVVIANCGPQGTPGGTIALLNGGSSGGSGQPTSSAYAFIGDTVTLTVNASQRLVIEAGSYNAGFADVQSGSLNVSYCYRPTAASTPTKFDLITAETTTAFASPNGITSGTAGTLGFGAGAPGVAGEYEVGLCGKYASGTPFGALFSQVNKVLVYVTE